MKLLNLASNNSFWRGIDYYHENRIIDWKELADNCYQGKVKGSGSAVYDVTIDVAHPRKSVCDCPFAEGRRVICKHMIALICGNRKPIMPEPIVIDNARDRRLYTYFKKISEMYDLLTVKIYVAMYGERDGFV